MKRVADPESAALIRTMVQQNKPIGAISLGGSFVSTALGLPLIEDPFSIPAASIVIDEKRGIVWTPGHMVTDSLLEIAAGIERMVQEVLKRANRELPVRS